MTRRRLLLPLAAVGLTALLPLPALDLMQRWHGMELVASGAAQPMPAPPPAPVAPAQPVAAASTQPPTSADRPVTDDRTADGRLLAEVARRNAELDHREHDLQTRAAQVSAAEQLAKQQLALLSRMRKEMEALVAQQSTAAEGDLDLLVALYSNMKPNQAAAVLGKLEAPKAAAILERLDTRSAGPVLAAMDPSAALAITEVLQQRRSAFRR